MIQQVRVDIKKIRELAAEGKSVEQIMKELNISGSEELKKALQGLMHKDESEKLPARMDFSESIVSIDQSGRILAQENVEKKEK